MLLFASSDDSLEPPRKKRSPATPETPATPEIIDLTTEDLCAGLEREASVTSCNSDAPPSPVFSYAEYSAAAEACASSVEASAQTPDSYESCIAAYALYRSIVDEHEQMRDLLPAERILLTASRFSLVPLDNRMPCIADPKVPIQPHQILEPSVLVFFIHDLASPGDFYWRIFSESELFDLSYADPHGKQDQRVTFQMVPHHFDQANRIALLHGYGAGLHHSVPLKLARISPLPMIHDHLRGWFHELLLSSKLFRTSTKLPFDPKRVHPSDFVNLQVKVCLVTSYYNQHMPQPPRLSLRAQAARMRTSLTPTP
jgi:hypothetical protein